MSGVNRIRVYICPFDENGNYAQYIDVTQDVDLSSLGSISQNLDNTDYDIGVYRTDALNLKMSNGEGLYSDVDQPVSIFRYKRGDSLVKITWEVEEEGPYAGVAIAGSSFLSVETTLFVGLLNDESLVMDLSTQEITFQVLGRESIFDRLNAPFASLSNGQMISSILLSCLNQAAITTLLTVSSGNISVGSDQAVDSVADFQNKSVKDSINDLLLLSNSVMYISGDSVIIAPRTPTVSVQKTFYGQGSQLGPENIQGIKSIKNGLSRAFNYLTWGQTSLVVQDTSSVTKYGVRERDFSFTYFSNSTSQNALLTSILSEFSTPKQEFDLYTSLDYSTVSLGLLSRVAVDYPTVYYSQGAQLPICGVAVCGSAVLPAASWAFVVDPTAVNFKIIGRSIDLKSEIVKFNLRKI